MIDLLSFFKFGARSRAVRYSLSVPRKKEPINLSLRCVCQRLELEIESVRPSVANRVICHCEGCQRFAERMAPALLDAHGGTERFSVSPASLRFVSGFDSLGCVQQSRKGALRWIARCCNTPLGLTLPSHRVPFVGLDVQRLDRRALAEPLEVHLGPLRARVNGHFRGEEAKRMQADFRSLSAMLMHLAPLTFTWWRRGDHLRSPFFQRPSGSPIVDVERLYEERALQLGRSGCR